MSVGVKEKVPRQSGLLDLGVDKPFTSTSAPNQTKGSAVVIHHEDNEEVDPFTTPQAQRTVTLPVGHRPVTRSLAKLLRPDTSVTPNTNKPFAWDPVREEGEEEVEEEEEEEEEEDDDDETAHPLTGELRLPRSSFSFRVGTSIAIASEPDENKTTGDEEYEARSIDVSGSFAGKRKRSIAAEEPKHSGSRGTKVPLRIVPFVERENVRDKTYRPSSSGGAGQRGAYQDGSQVLRRSLRLQLSTPATSMERVFSSLPPELQVAFWQTAAAHLAPSFRRVVYIRNSVARNHTPDALNPLPPLFHVSVEARKAIMKHYRKMFARIIPATYSDESSLRHLLSAASVVSSGSGAQPGVDQKLFPPAPVPPAAAATAAIAAPGPASSAPLVVTTTTTTTSNNNNNNSAAAAVAAAATTAVSSIITQNGARLHAALARSAPQPAEMLDFSSYQFVNPDSDIIVLAPCCSGCRAYHCARKQFRESDRAAVRFLALRTEAENLAPATRPAWATASVAWPNVETLYLITNLAGPDAVNWSRRRAEWALLRMEKEGPREELLRRRFNEWKIAEGFGGGKASKMSSLEFVVLVPRVRQFSVGIEVGGLYSSAQRRVTDEGVIIG